MPLLNVIHPRVIDQFCDLNVFAHETRSAEGASQPREFRRYASQEDFEIVRLTCQRWGFYAFWSFFMIIKLYEARSTVSSFLNAILFLNLICKY